MAEFGQIMVYVSMVLSAGGGALVLSGAHRKTLSLAGYRLLGAAALGATVSLMALVFLLLSHDYRVAYVHEYANRSMPTGYLVTAVWGGQEGSLLLWAALQTWLTAVLANFGSRRPAFAIGFLASLQTYFLVLVVFHSNPFELLGGVEMSGVGMNPLLLNPFMTIHPPTLFLGFVGFSVPFALALDALAEGDGTDTWVEQARPWILFAWLFLGVGNLVGMVWAYEELGWGGYWGWDPVENASFIPWLTGTALLHTATVQRSRKLYRALNAALAALTFVLTIFGTFITRSGVIQSVHSFAGATVGPYLLGLIAVSVGLFIGLTLYRKRSFHVEPPSLAMLSRENLLLITAWLLVISAVFVWSGTMAPLFTELFRGEKVALTPAFFNRWMVPLGLSILAVLGVCALLSRRGDRESWIVPGVVLGAASAAGLTLFGWRGIFAAVSFGLVGLAGATVTRRLFRIVRGISAPTGLTLSRRRRIGAEIVHLSVVVLFLGFTGAAYSVEDARLLLPDQSMRVGAYDITYLGFRDETDFMKSARFADLRVRRAGRAIGLFPTARFVYHSHPRQPTSEVEIYSTLKEDLFLVLGDTDDQNGAAVIRAVVNPLVMWIWIGGGVLALGTVISLFPRVRFETLSRDDVIRRLLNVGLPAALSAAVFSFTWATRGIAMAVAAGIGIGLIGLVLLLGSALFAVAEEAAR